jgi:hypothetical protein
MALTDEQRNDIAGKLRDEMRLNGFGPTLYDLALRVAEVESNAVTLHGAPVEQPAAPASAPVVTMPPAPAVPA